MRILTWLIVSFYSATALAFDVSNRWDADVVELGCLASIRTGINILTDGSRPGLDVFDVEVRLNFGKLNPGAKNPYEGLPGFPTVSTIVTAQVLPNLEIRRNNVAISDVLIVAGDRRFDLVRDPDHADASLPVYLLGGSTADDLWALVSAGVRTNVQLTLGKSEAVTIEIPTHKVSIVKAMYDACVKASAESSTDDT